MPNRCRRPIAPVPPPISLIRPASRIPSPKPKDAATMHDSQWKQLFCVSLMSAVLTITGCAEFKQWMHNGKVGPDYMKPAVPVADEWIDFNDPRRDQPGTMRRRECMVAVPQRSRLGSAGFPDARTEPVSARCCRHACDGSPSTTGGCSRPVTATAPRSSGQLQSHSSQPRWQLDRFDDVAGPRFDFWSTGFNVGWELDVWVGFAGTWMPPMRISMRQSKTMTTSWFVSLPDGRGVRRNA